MNLVESGGVYEELALGTIYDVSAHNDNQTFNSLSDLLNNPNLSTLIPSSIRKGGMSIKFIDSSDNKYVQYRYLLSSVSNSDFSNVANWVGIDEEPIANSKNLVESGGVASSMDKGFVLGKGDTMTISPLKNLIPNHRYALHILNSDCYYGSGSQSVFELWYGSNEIRNRTTKNDIVAGNAPSIIYFNTTSESLTLSIVARVNSGDKLYYCLEDLGKYDRYNQYLTKPIYVSYNGNSNVSTLFKLNNNTRYKVLVQSELTSYSGSKFQIGYAKNGNYTNIVDIRDQAPQEELLLQTLDDNAIDYYYINIAGTINKNVTLYLEKLEAFATDELLKDISIVDKVLSNNNAIVKSSTLANVLLQDAEAVEELVNRNGDLTWLSKNISNGEPIDHWANKLCLITATSDKIRFVKKTSSILSVLYKYDSNGKYVIIAGTDSFDKIVDVSDSVDGKFAILLYKNPSAVVTPSEASAQDITITEYDTEYDEYDNMKGISPRMDEAEGRISQIEPLVHGAYAYDNFLSARKNELASIFVVRPSAMFIRETGNIVWKGAEQRLIINPSTNYDCADPSVIKIGDWYYVVKTGFPMPIYRSQDLANWEFYRNVFPGNSSSDPFGDGSSDPMGMGTTSLQMWAPSIFEYNNKIYIYVYTIDWTGNHDRRATNILVADDIDSEFTRVGMLINNFEDTSTTEGDVQYFLDTDGNKYICMGDTSPLKIQQLASDCLSVVGDRVTIASGEIQGPYLFKRNGVYYVFYSLGTSSSWTYTVTYRKSNNIFSGWSEPTTILAASDSSQPLNSTGGVGGIVEDKDGKYYMIMHCHAYGLTPGDNVGYGKRYLYIQEIVFDENGDVHFVDAQGTTNTLPQWITRCPNV